jgi:hypothetical protein
MSLTKRIRTRAILLLFILFAASSYADLLEEFPSLKKYTFREKDSSLYLGFGISPISLLNNQVFFTADIFELHYIRPLFDFELINASFGISLASDSTMNSNHFTFRTSPKYRVTQTISIGPMVGWEFVSFPGITDQLFKNNLSAPDGPFSSQGLVFGVEANENFSFGPDYFFKMSQLVYKQTYSVTQTGDGWTYLFDRADLQQNPNTIGPGWVFMLEFSLLY